MLSRHWLAKSVDQQDLTAGNTIKHIKFTASSSFGNTFASSDKCRWASRWVETVFSGPVFSMIYLMVWLFESSCRANSATGLESMPAGWMAASMLQPRCSHRCQRHEGNGQQWTSYWNSRISHPAEQIRFSVGHYGRGICTEAKKVERKVSGAVHADHWPDFLNLWHGILRVSLVSTPQPELRVYPICKISTIWLESCSRSSFTNLKGWWRLHFSRRAYSIIIATCMTSCSEAV